ncbi:MAG: class I SAM-dependent methyltransferase [Chitinophagaceae bacterium]|nr:MAG: class I SAM-dependent methyltransferase [Chitinophagaceae bacterium]
MNKKIVIENINDRYFDGFYQEIWRQTVPEQTTAKEIAYIIEGLKTPSGGHVIDLMCGYGRHSIALASQGFKVTAVDNLANYTDEILKVAAKESLSIEVVNANIATFTPPEATAELCICMGNSINFFPEKDVKIILERMHGALKTYGKILINTWSLIEIVTKGFVSNSWSEFEDLTLLSESRYLFNPTRVETSTTILKNGAVAEVKLAIDYLFGMSELISLIEAVGFQEVKAFSIPGRKEFQLGDSRAYIVATKL